MKKLRKIQALLLSLALLVPIACNGTAVSILNDTQAVSAPLNFDEAVVESVKKESDNPDRACEMINDIDDTATYEEALRTVLDGYYLESNTTSIESLEKSIDPRGEEILENYENAADERNTDETELGYMSGEVLAVVKKGIAQEDIPSLFEDGRTNVTAISDYTDGKKLIKLSIPLEDTVEYAMNKLEQNSYVDYVQKNYVYKSESIYAEEVLNDYYADNLYYLNAVNAPDAWKFIKGVPHEKIRVGIIDTGAQLDHPEGFVKKSV